MSAKEARIFVKLCFFGRWVCYTAASFTGCQRPRWFGCFRTMADVRRPISRSVPGRIDAGRSSRSSRGSMPMHELRYLSSLDDVHRLWLQAYVARADLAGFQAVRFPDLAGFGSRISRCVCVTDFDDGPGRMIGLRAFRPGLAIEPQALRPGWQELVADVKGRCSRQVLAVRDPPCMSSRSGSECFDLRWRPELQEL